MQLARKQLALGRMPGGFHDALSRALAKLRFHAVRYNGPGRRGPQIRGFEGSQMLPGIFGELLRRILGACPSTRAEELKASGMKLRPRPPLPSAQACTSTPRSSARSSSGSTRWENVPYLSAERSLSDTARARRLALDARTATALRRQ